MTLTDSGTLLLPAAVLDEAGRFFEDRGALGLEGTAMISGPLNPRLVVPDQHAVRTRHGVSVELTAHGQYQLACASGGDVRLVARIHSHPDAAFHSATDDRNPVITFDGALSIVVPFYGLGLRLGLDACAVYRRDRDRWRELPPGDERNRWVRVSPCPPAPAASTPVTEGGPDDRL